MTTMNAHYFMKYGLAKVIGDCQDETVKNALLRLYEEDTSMISKMQDDIQSKLLEVA